MEFTGQCVLVTGGTRGIGRAVAKAFANEGASVAFTYRSSTDEAEALRHELTACGVQAKAFQSDAADFASAEAVVAGVVDAWGRIDVLINNAGITRDGLILRMGEADWDAVLATNLKSVFNFSKAVYRPMMVRRRGRIINVSSVVGLMGNAGQANYAASKAGIIGFSKSLAKELGRRGITVNVVAPGYVLTDMTEVLHHTVQKAMLAQIPLRRAAKPEEIAGPILFLASSAAEYITGQVLRIDGGLAM